MGTLASLDQRREVLERITDLCAEATISLVRMLCDRLVSRLKARKAEQPSLSRYEVARVGLSSLVVEL